MRTNRREPEPQKENLPATRPVLNRRQQPTYKREDLPRLLHRELQSIPLEDRAAIGPVLLRIFGTNSNPLIEDAEKLATLGTSEASIAKTWGLTCEQFETLKDECEELAFALLRGYAKYQEEQQLMGNGSPFALTISEEDLDNLDVSKLKDGMYKGIYALEAALFSQAGFEYHRVEKLRRVLTTLEVDVLNPAELSNMTRTEKLNFYNEMNRTMRHSMGFLSKLHDSVASGLEAVSSVEKHRSSKEKVDSSVIVNEDVNEIKQQILAAIKEKAGQR